MLCDHSLIDRVASRVQLDVVVTAVLPNSARSASLGNGLNARKSVNDMSTCFEPVNMNRAPSADWRNVSALPSKKDEVALCLGDRLVRDVLLSLRRKRAGSNPSLRQLGAPGAQRTATDN